MNTNTTRFLQKSLIYKIRKSKYVIDIHKQYNEAKTRPIINIVFERQQMIQRKTKSKKRIFKLNIYQLLFSHKIKDTFTVED